MILFENDVELYGTQTIYLIGFIIMTFENDVELYGTQTIKKLMSISDMFENDVELYGTQTIWVSLCKRNVRLRMM